METLHPAIIHFAIVLPLVALSFQGLYLLKSDKSYNKAVLILMVFTAIFTIVAYLSGVSAAQAGVAETFDTYYSEGLKELKEHADIGFRLLLIMFLLALIKVSNFFFIKKKSLDIVFALLLTAASGYMLFQAKEGGAIVYEHGTLFEAYELKDTLKESLIDLQDTTSDSERVEILQDSIKSALKIEE